MPKLLELCSGSGVVSAYFRAQGWETLTVDTDWRCRPDLRMDVRDIELSRWEPGEFDAIWASPPCQEYSIAKQGARDMETADQIVIWVFELIKHLTNCEKQVIWIVENPMTGRLKSRECMAEWAQHMRKTCYCQYGTPYRKATALWTNLDNWTLRPMCLKGSRCPGYLGSSHICSAQKGPSKIQGINPPHDNLKTTDLYGIPGQLIAELFACIEGRRR